MTNTRPSFRTARGRAEGLGSSGHGTEHWWHQCLSSLAIIVLSGYFVPAFFCHVVFGSYHEAITWLQSPFPATIMVLTLFAGLHHMVAGAEVIMEDYIHVYPVMRASVIAVKFIAIALGVLGALCVAKIFLAPAAL